MKIKFSLIVLVFLFYGCDPFGFYKDCLKPSGNFKHKIEFGLYEETLKVSAYSGCMNMLTRFNEDSTYIHTVICSGTKDTVVTLEGTFSIQKSKK